MKNVMTALALLLCRVSLGLLFFFAGYRKIVPGEGETVIGKIGKFVNDNVVPNAPLPEMLAKIYGYSLPFVELIAGALLVVGLWGRVAAMLIALMLLSFMIAFGIGWWPEQGGVFDKNVVFFTLALLLAATGMGKLSIDALFCCKPSAPKA